MLYNLRPIQGIIAINITIRAQGMPTFNKYYTYILSHLIVICLKLHFPIPAYRITSYCNCYNYSRKKMVRLYQSFTIKSPSNPKILPNSIWRIQRFCQNLYDWIRQIYCMKIFNLFMFRWLKGWGVIDWPRHHIEKCLCMKLTLT